MTVGERARMVAAVYVGDGELDVTEIEVPPLGPTDVLVEISHCGICGTDLHLVLERFARPGSVLGHEWSGTVVEVGTEVERWRPGDRVVGNPSPGCGECRACRRGRPSVCLRREATDHLAFRGAFCRYRHATEAELSPIPDGLATRAAALTEPTAIALHTVRVGDVQPGDRVLVTGAGPVGLLTLAVLRAQGVDDVTVVEPSEVRRARAVELGARAALEPADLPRASMGRTVAEPFSVAFECSGQASAAEAALDQLDFAGTLVFVGTGSSFPRVNHNRMIILELTATGAYNYDADGFAGALDLLASGTLPLDLLIEPVDVPLTALAATLVDLAGGRIAGKVLVTPEVG